MKYELISKLEKIAVQVNNSETLGEAKGIAFSGLMTVSINEKMKKIILDNIYKINDLFELQKYICNSLLFFEGMSTGGYNKRKK